MGSENLIACVCFFNQRCKGNKAILVLELATRFYLYSELKLVSTNMIHK